jgi:hypothetical protein
MELREFGQEGIKSALVASKVNDTRRMSEEGSR